MANVDSHAPGSFCWFELGTTDQNAAKSFYNGLFGWDSEDSPIGPNEVYTMFRLKSRDVGAAYTLRPDMISAGVPPHWLPYICVGSADKSAAAAAEHGGTIVVSPFDVMTFGRMAVVRDPTGATFAIWEPKAHAGTGIAGVDGTVVWADLNTPDPAKAGEFYTGVFGWTYTKGQHDPTGYLHIQNGESYIGGIASQTNEQKAPPHWILYFQVADVDAATAKVEQLGGRTYMPPMEVPGAGRFSIVADPQGTVFALWKTARS